MFFSKKRLLKFVVKQHFNFRFSMIHKNNNSQINIKKNLLYFFHDNLNIIFLISKFPQNIKFLFINLKPLSKIIQDYDSFQNKKK